MQLNGNTAGEYLSRKFVLAAVSLMVVLLMFIYAMIVKPQVDVLAWGGLIVGIISSYGYFNSKESSAIKELKIKEMDAAVPADENGEVKHTND
jgi:uncharacterized membrane protein